MAKYLLSVSYNPEGAKGLLKDGGTKRKQVAEQAIKSAGGKLDLFYFAFGAHDATCRGRADHQHRAADIAINASGAVRSSTTVLITPEEIDQAVKKGVTYHPPGH